MSAYGRREGHAGFSTSPGAPVKGPGPVSCSSLSFSSPDLNNSLNIMPSFSLTGMKQAEEKKYFKDCRDREQKESREEIRSRRISSAQDFHVFEHIHIQLTCPWLDSYLWATSVRGKRTYHCEFSERGGGRGGRKGRNKRSETDWKHLINPSCQPQNRKAAIKREYRDTQAVPQLRVSKRWP